MSDFNGGKMENLFSTQYTNPGLYDLVLTSDIMTLIEKGKFYIKVNGACGAIINNIPYMRYDKKGKDIPADCIPLPDGPYNSFLMKKEKISHDYVFQRIPDPEAEGLSTANKLYYHQMYEIAKQFPSNSSQTVEWVGTRTQNVAEFDVAIAAVAHQSLAITNLEELIGGVRTLENLVEYMINSPIEGFIIEHPETGYLVKFRSNMLDKNCVYEQMNKKYIQHLSTVKKCKKNNQAVPEWKNLYQDKIIPIQLILPN